MLLNLALVDFRILIVVYADHQNIARVAHNDCIDAKGQPNHILIMHVFPSTQVHANQADEVCLRVGDKSKKLNFDQRLQLMYSKGTRFLKTPLMMPPMIPLMTPPMMKLRSRRKYWHSVLFLVPVTKCLRILNYQIGRTSGQNILIRYWLPAS